MIWLTWQQDGMFFLPLLLTYCRLGYQESIETTDVACCTKIVLLRLLALPG
jgi:hypothetical protein